MAQCCSKRDHDNACGPDKIVHSWYHDPTYTLFRWLRRWVIAIKKASHCPTHSRAHVKKRTSAVVSLYGHVFTSVHDVDFSRLFARFTEAAYGTNPIEFVHSHKAVLVTGQNTNYISGLVSTTKIAARYEAQTKQSMALYLCFFNAHGHLGIIAYFSLRHIEASRLTSFESSNTLNEVTRRRFTANGSRNLAYPERMSSLAHARYSPFATIYTPYRRWRTEKQALC